MIRILANFNETVVPVSVFKGGEVNVRLTQKQIDDICAFGELNIKANLTDSVQLIALMLTVDAIRTAVPEAKIDLHIPYFPYARQDRVCNPGEALSVRVAAKLINSLNVDRVIITDPHSDVTPALIDRCMIVDQAMIITDRPAWRERFRLNKETYLLAPDAGAVKKIHALSTDPDIRTSICSYVTASKHRDLETGEISKTTVNGCLTDANVLVVDDICDGGRTFIELGKVLHADGVLELNLFVTHGIFSYGVDALLEQYNYIFTTDSFHPDKDSELRKKWDTYKDADGNPRIIFITA